MAKDPLDEMNEDLDDSMEDILENAMDEVPEDSMKVSKDVEKASLMNSLSGKFQILFKKIPTLKKIMIITAVFVVCILLMGTGFLIFVFNDRDEVSQSPGVPVHQSTNQDSVRIVEEIAFEDIMELEPFERVSLKSSSSMKTISLNMALELVDKNERKQIYAVEEQIRQIVLDQMANMTWLELRNPEGKIRLKYDLLKQMNSLFPKTTVRNVYFTYFVMQ